MSEQEKLLTEAELLEKICGPNPPDGVVQDLIRRLGLEMANKIYQKCVAAGGTEE